MSSLYDPQKFHQVRSYDAIARWYDSFSAVYSFGMIRQSKVSQIDFLQPGANVLYAGCGQGTDVVAAANIGCRVTAVDSSRKMLRHLQRRLARDRLTAKLICGHVEQLRYTCLFEAVTANYFLNCFPMVTARRLVSVLRKSLKTGGRLLIADVAPPSGGATSRLINNLYLHAAMFPFWIGGLVHWHRNHDYLEILVAEGFEIERVESFALFNFGPFVFRNIVARLPANLTH